jgi:uncharacterized protein DUF3658
MTMSPDEIDRVILERCRDNWLKVARVIVDTREALGVPTDLEIAHRIEMLVKAGKLESQGNLARWRFSEVRLPQH